MCFDVAYLRHRMREAVHRSFEVAVPVNEAWARLSEVERWPEWAPHISAVTVSPAGPLGPSSSGVLNIRGLGRNAFRMSAWLAVRGTPSVA